MPRKYLLQNDLTGQHFGRLTALEPVEYVIHWKCRCVCGKVTYARTQALLKGQRVSCGCQNIDRLKATMTKHGMFRSALYKRHTNMMQRCYNPNTTQFHRYGGRGITVCRAWHDFEMFHADFGSKRPSPKHSIERIENNKGYWCGKCAECLGNGQPANCRWATQKEQTRNRCTTRFLTFKDQTKSIQEWSELSGISYDTIWDRVHLFNWSVEDALTLAPSPYFKERKELLPSPPG